MQNFTIKDYQAYLFEHYRNRGIDTNLFLKLVEEVGEIAEVFNKRDGRKSSNGEDLKSQLANEIVDVIHYSVAIAALNNIDLSSAILNKDKEASIRYNHVTDFETFLKNK